MSPRRWDAYVAGILLGYIIKDTVAEPTPFHIVAAVALGSLGAWLFCKRVQ